MFEIGTLDRFELTKGMIAQRRVWVGVPETKGSAQWAQLQRAIEYGTAQGVDVKIFKVGH